MRKLIAGLAIFILGLVGCGDGFSLGCCKRCVMFSGAEGRAYGEGSSLGAALIR